MSTVFLMDGPPPMANVMLDLETWGTAPGSALRSIGAVEFDPHSDLIGETFYANIQDESCELVGLVKDAGTVAWWNDPRRRAAQDALSKDQCGLGKVITDFAVWWIKVRGVFVWSQGANFDQPLWEAACRAVGAKVPWKFTDSRCTRTAYDVCGFNPYIVKRRGTHHNALDDAIHQARCVQAAYRNIARVRDL